MALFKAIKTADDLPEEGSSYERAQLEFKKLVNGNRRYELAKDVAALANATGGVILVGIEDEHEQLARYVPLTQQDAEETRRAVNDAVSDRCFPSPHCEPEIVARDGGFVVAINVWPLPDQLVGVKAPIEKEAGEKKPQWAFVFPVRKHTGTDFLKPQELAPLMLPKIRHAAIALESIPEGQRQNLTLTYQAYRDVKLGAAYVNVNIQTARATFLVSHGGEYFNRNQNQELVLPLQAIDSVQPLTGDRWRICLSGHLKTGFQEWAPWPFSSFSP